MRKLAYILSLVIEITSAGVVVPSDSEGGKLLNISLASVADNIGERPVPCIAIRASRDDELVSDLHTTGRTGRKTIKKEPK